MNSRFWADDGQTGSNPGKPDSRHYFRFADHSGVGLFNHHKRVYREQSANPEALLPASPLSLAEFDPVR
jgi:hypothetical protein